MISSETTVGICDFRLWIVDCPFIHNPQSHIQNSSVCVQQVVRMIPPPVYQGGLGKTYAAKKSRTHRLDQHGMDALWPRRWRGRQVGG